MHVACRRIFINSTVSRIVQRLGYSAFISSDLKHRKDPGSIPGTGKAFLFALAKSFEDAGRPENPGAECCASRGATRDWIPVGGDTTLPR
jgi:hypothetical protein